MILYLCNCQCATPPGQRLGHHIEKMIDPKKHDNGHKREDYLIIDLYQPYLHFLHILFIAHIDKAAASFETK